MHCFVVCVVMAFKICPLALKIASGLLAMCSIATIIKGAYYTNITPIVVLGLTIILLFHFLLILKQITLTMRVLKMSMLLGRKLVVSIVICILEFL